jgi:glycosyltransferase involved in cell wall biosynthesis
MRIALVTTEFPTERRFDGGLGNYLARLSWVLRLAGHDALVITVSDRTGEIEHQGVPVHRVDGSWNAWQRWSSRLLLHQAAHPLGMRWLSRRLNRRLGELHAAQPIDVVQFSHLGATAFHRDRTIPTMVRLSSWQPLYAAAGDGEVAGFQGWAQNRMEQRALVQADLVYGPCRFIADTVRQVIHGPIEVLENPFLLDDPGDHEPAHPIPGPYLLTFGTLNRLKGIEVLAQTIPAILQRHPELRWVLVGKEIPAGTVERIRQAAGGAAERIIHLPPLAHDSLYPLIRRAVLVILPSLVDNLPNACLEAMALAKPVVGSTPTGMEQVIDHDLSGFLVPAGDANALTTTVDRALSLGPGRLEALGRSARARIDLLHPDLLLPRYLDLCQKAIAANRQRS